MSGRQEKAARRAAGVDLKAKRAQAIADRERADAELAERYRAADAARAWRASRMPAALAVSAALAVGP